MSTINDTDLFLVNRGGASYKMQYVNYASALATDTFLVSRAGTSYQVTKADLESKLLGSDLLLCNRNGVSYKVTGADFLSGFVCTTDTITAYEPGLVTFASTAGFECIADGSAIKQNAPLTPVTSQIITVGANPFDRVAQLSTRNGGTLVNPEYCWDGNNATGVTNSFGNNGTGITWTPSFGDDREVFNCGTLITVNCPAGMNITYDGRYTTGNTPISSTVDGDNTFEVCYSGADSGYVQYLYVTTATGDQNARINSISVNGVMLVGGPQLTFQDDTQLNNFQPGDIVQAPDVIVGTVTPNTNQMVVSGGTWNTGETVTGPLIDGTGTCDSKDSGASQMTVSGPNSRFAVGTKIEAST